MKAPGISLTMGREGPIMRVTSSTHAEDAIWDAVEKAIEAGMTVEKFRNEAADAWDYTLKQRAKDDAKKWANP